MKSSEDPGANSMGDDMTKKSLNESVELDETILERSGSNAELTKLSKADSEEPASNSKPKASFEDDMDFGLKVKKDDVELFQKMFGSVAGEFAAPAS